MKLELDKFGSRDRLALALPDSMATNLAPVDSREVVRCDRCLLVQFRTTNSICRRCRGSLDEDEPEIISAPPPPQVMPHHGHGRGHLHLAASIRSMRLRNGLSQRQLALRMSVPRTYVSKIENEKATPTLSSLERLARALEVTVPDLLCGGETQSPGRNRRAYERPVCCGNAAIPLGTEWHADVERFNADAGFDDATATHRIESFIRATSQQQPGPKGSGFFLMRLITRFFGWKTPARS